MNLKSVLDNVIFLDIETTGLNHEKDEIIEIGAIKIENSVVTQFRTLIKPRVEVKAAIYHLCTGLTKEALDKAPTLLEVKKAFLSFIGHLPLICHNGDFEDKFLRYHFKGFSNTILDSMELAAILEPGSKAFNLEALLNSITTFNRKEAHRGLEDSIDTIYVVNALLCRLWQREELSKKYSLYEEVCKIFTDESQWKWKEYLVRPVMLNWEDYPYVVYKDRKSTFINSRREIDFERFEELLKDTDIWDGGEEFKYVYREYQRNISEKVRKNYEKSGRVFIEAPTGSGKTFAYVLIVAILAHLNKTNRNYEDSNFFISTDTKELQNQLIEKDILNILSKLGLLYKISFGAMKGKGNYLCFERLLTAKELQHNEGRLTYLFLRRLGMDGLYGDLENINYWAIKHFDIDKYISHINCDSENCNLDRCKRPCYLRERYNTLPKENITVINHSLLASWPYTEKRKITHLVLDEAHNLMEKSYDFFSEEFNTKEFNELLTQINDDHQGIIKMLSRLNATHGYKENIDGALIKERKNNIAYKISSILNELERMRICKGEYNLQEEYFNPEEENKAMIESSKEHFLELGNHIKDLYKLLDRHLNNIVTEDDEDGSNEYKHLVNYIAKIKGASDVIENFLNYREDYGKNLEISKEYTYFTLKNIPLEIGKLINERILTEVKSTVFISATLRINNSFNNIKRILGQEKADMMSVPPVFNLRGRTKIFIANNLGRYNTKDFIDNTAKFIFQTAKITNGHILVLFNNNNRRDNVEEALIRLTRGTDFEVHKSKKSIPYLKDENRKVIILGSKGFFEGIDVPGDALTCVMIDKIPNIPISDVLYKALKRYNGIDYRGYNYPKICIKMKQSYGRLVRSSYDYGYFVILDGGENLGTIAALGQDLRGPIINKTDTATIVNSIQEDFNRWKLPPTQGRR